MADATAHLNALASAYDAAVAEIGRAAQSAHAQIDGDLSALQQLAGSANTRPPLIPNVPIDEPPPYVPPPPSAQSHNALIPDTPLVDSPLSNSSLAFDDAPLWQS
jgi:hypothetical protein